MSGPRATVVRAPTDRTSGILMALGAGAALLGVAAWGPVGALVGASFAALGVRQRVHGRAVMRTHAALQAITRGQMEEAEAHLDAIPRWVARGGSIMRSVAYQRALVAFYRSDALRAAAELEPATTTKTKSFTHNYEHMQRSLALSLRALALASSGEEARAKADVAAVVASAHATPEALARARLAEAVIFARTNDLESLAAHFRAHGALMLEYAFPRERVLARALKKTLQARSRSVYREAARIEEPAAERGALGEWIARIAPDAAEHVTEAGRLTERADVAPPPVATPEAMQAIANARQAASQATWPKRKNHRVRLVAVWAALVVAMLAVWQMLSVAPARERSSAPHEAAAFASGLFGPLTFAALLFGAVAIAFAAQVRKARRMERDVLGAQRAIADGDMTRAEPLLTALESSSGLGPTQSFFLRAKQAEQHARFADCIALCDRALGALAAQPDAQRVVASVALTPSILGLRALALAATGREGEANAELATIARQHATWSHRAMTELRVRLMLAVRRADLDAARAVARERTPELPITLRDEALADLVSALAPSGASRDEQERVDGELREDRVVSAWVDAVAPGLREQLARRVSGKELRIAPSSLDEEIHEDTIDAEREAFGRA